MILLSICIPTFNRGQMALRAVEEYLRIPTDKIEVIVVDDCSTDNTQEILSSIRDRRFHYYRNETNIAYPNMVNAMTKAHGKFCWLVRDKDTAIQLDWDRIFWRLENHGDTVVFIGTCCHFEGTVYRGYPLNHKLPANRSETYMWARKLCSHASAMMVHRQSMMDHLHLVDKQSYLWSVYPQVCAILPCLQYGSMDAMQELITLMPRQDINVVSSWYGTSDEPYWTVLSRLRQAIDYFRLYAAFDIPRDQHILLLQSITTEMLNNIVSYHNWLYSKEASESPCQDIVARDRALSITEWHYRFWECYLILNQKLSDIYGHLSLVNPSMLERVFEIYGNFAKQLKIREDSISSKNSDLSW